MGVNPGELESMTDGDVAILAFRCLVRLDTAAAAKVVDDWSAQLPTDVGGAPAVDDPLPGMSDLDDDQAEVDASKWDFHRDEEPEARKAADEDHLMSLPKCLPTVARREIDGVVYVTSKDYNFAVAQIVRLEAPHIGPFDDIHDTFDKLKADREAAEAESDPNRVLRIDSPADGPSDDTLTDPIPSAEDLSKVQRHYDAILPDLDPQSPQKPSAGEDESLGVV